MDSDEEREMAELRRNAKHTAGPARREYVAPAMPQRSLRDEQDGSGDDDGNDPGRAQRQAAGVPLSFGKQQSNSSGILGDENLPDPGTVPSGTAKKEEEERPAMSFGVIWPEAEAAANGTSNVPFPLSSISTFGLPHEKSLTTVAVDGTGNWVAYGGLDKQVSVMDYGASDSALEPKLRSTVTLRGEEEAMIRQIAFAPEDQENGDFFAIAKTVPECVIVSKKLGTLEDSNLRYVVSGKTKKGFGYVTQMKNTTGHVEGITGVSLSLNHDSQAKQKKKEKKDKKKNKTGGAGASKNASTDRLLVTCSTDSSIRVWNYKEAVKFEEETCKAVAEALADRRNRHARQDPVTLKAEFIAVCKDKRGHKAKCMSLVVTGKYYGALCSDGDVRFFEYPKPPHRPVYQITRAVPRSSDSNADEEDAYGSAVASPLRGIRQVAVRSHLDGQIRIFDCKKPRFTLAKLLLEPSADSETAWRLPTRSCWAYTSDTLVYTDDGLHIVAGFDDGCVRFWNTSSLTDKDAGPTKTTIELLPACTIRLAEPGISLVSVRMHDRTGQLVAACSDGTIRVAHDLGRAVSSKGVLTALRRTSKKRSRDGFARINQPIMSGSATSSNPKLTKHNIDATIDAEKSRPKVPAPSIPVTPRVPGLLPAKAPEDAVEAVREFAERKKKRLESGEWTTEDEIRTGLFDVYKK